MVLCRCDRCGAVAEGVFVHGYPSSWHPPGGWSWARVDSQEYHACGAECARTLRRQGGDRLTFWSDQYDADGERVGERRTEDLDSTYQAVCAVTSAAPAGPGDGKV